MKKAMVRRQEVMVSVPFHIKEKLAVRDLSTRELRTELMYLSTEEHWGLKQKTSILRGRKGQECGFKRFDICVTRISYAENEFVNSSVWRISEVSSR